MTEGHWLGDVLLRFPAGFESLVVTPYSYGVRLGLFPGGVDARNVTQPYTVEYLRFLDRARRKRFVLALEDPKSDRVSPCTVLNGFDVLGLLPGFPYRVYSWNEGAGEVKKDRLNGLRGVGGSEDRGQGG